MYIGALLWVGKFTYGFRIMVKVWKAACLTSEARSLQFSDLPNHKEKSISEFQLLIEAGIHIS